MTTNERAVSKPMLWGGWALTILPAAVLILSGFMKVLKPEFIVTGFAHMGWPSELAVGLGIVEITSAVLYLIPRTAVLGAILLTGYLGGAVATHLRIGEPIFGAVGLGVIVWLGLYLRDARIRALAPLRS